MTEATEPDWHGWSVLQERAWSLHIGELPGRKSICLYEQDSSTIRPLAYFKSEREAKRALWALDRLLWPTKTPYEPMPDA